MLRVSASKSVWPTAKPHRSLGQRPRKTLCSPILGRRPYSHGPHRLVNMAFGQYPECGPASWGVAPGYGKNWPSAKNLNRNAQLRNAPARDTSRRFALVSLAGASRLVCPRIMQGNWAITRLGRMPDCPDGGLPAEPRYPVSVDGRS